MAKIRGFKPDLWTDEEFVELSPYARLLWMGMWNYACDNGHLADKSKQIKMRILPTDDINCAELLREIEGRNLIERADGWITIPNLTWHQKPDRRYFNTCEKEGCEAPPETIAKRAARRANTGHTPGTQGVHDVCTPGAHVDGDGDGDGEYEGDSDGDGEAVVAVVQNAATALPSVAPPTEPDRFAEFWAAYPRSTGKPKAGAAYKRARRRASQQTIIDGARAYAEDPNREDAYTAMATTWLNRDGWDDPPLPDRRRPGPNKVQDGINVIRQLQAEESQGAPRGAIA